MYKIDFIPEGYYQVIKCDSIIITDHVKVEKRSHDNMTGYWVIINGIETMVTKEYFTEILLGSEPFELVSSTIYKYLDENFKNWYVIQKDENIYSTKPL